MSIFSIYLCSGMQNFGSEHFDKSNEWRVECKEQLIRKSQDSCFKLNVINPNDYFSFKDGDPDPSIQLEAMLLDLYKLRNSQLIIVNFNDKYSLGSMSEIAIAYDRRIPIVGLNVSGQELHPWQNNFCSRIFDNLDELTDYVYTMYLT